MPSKKKMVFLDGREVTMTSIEYNLLEMFALKPGKTFNRDEILNYLQSLDADVFSRSINIAVSRLRQKLGDSKKTQRFIKTIWGTGYVFAGKVL